MQVGAFFEVYGKIKYNRLNQSNNSNNSNNSNESIEKHIVGSNIFNLGLVLGLSAMVFGDGIAVPRAAVALDMPLMLAGARALLPIAFTGFVIARWEGTLFVALYGAYLVYVVFAATDHDALAGLTTAMVWFVLPLVAMTLIAVTAYEIGIRRGRKTLDGAEPGAG
jgi:cation:H+ antiporter